jgi:transposase-like protein
VNEQRHEIARQVVAFASQQDDAVKRLWSKFNVQLEKWEKKAQKKMKKGGKMSARDENIMLFN